VHAASTADWCEQPGSAALADRYWQAALTRLDDTHHATGNHKPPAPPGNTR